MAVKPFKYTQHGRSVRLQRQLQLNIRPTIHEVFPGNFSSGKMIIRETSFRESDHPGNDFPGNVFPGKKPSGKVTIRETTVYRIYQHFTFLQMFYLFYLVLLLKITLFNTVQCLWEKSHEIVIKLLACYDLRVEKVGAHAAF